MTTNTLPLDSYSPAVVGFACIEDGIRYDHVSADCPEAGRGEPTDDRTSPDAWPCGSCFIYTPAHLQAIAFEAERDLPTGGGSTTRTAEPATPKQVAFIARLRDERGIATPADEQLTKRQASKAIDELMATPKATAAEAPAGVRPNRYAARCAACSVEVPAGEGSLTREAGKWVTRHLVCPEAPAADAAPAFEPDEGQFHRVDGELRRVRRTRSGQLVGQQVHVLSEAEWNGTELVRAADIEWEYLGKRGLRGMTADTLLDANEAAAFGHATGRCAFCSTALEDERSVSAGYGPICADKNGLPWGG